MGTAGDESIGVLLVDDQPEVAAVTRTHLERQNAAFEVVVEHAAREALERLDDSVDCVVSDYEMPGADGLEFLRDVRRLYPNLPFVLFTGRGSEEIASEAISAGVTDYLQKETGSDQYAVLANRVENAVARRRSEAAVAETESRYRSLLESLPHAILVHDGEAIRYGNERLAELVGVEDRETIYDADPLEYVLPEDRTAAAERIERVVEEGEPADWFEFRVQADDDELRWVESRAVPVHYEGDRTSQVVLRDVTERHRREERLATLNEATRRLLTAGDATAVAGTTVDVLEEVFDEPIGVVWEHDEDAAALVPAAATTRAASLADADSAPGVPPLGADTPEMSVFRGGEPRVLEDYAERSDAVSDAIETTFLFPLGDHGMLGTAVTEPRTFDATERELMGILARSVVAALDRVTADE